ncbi:MAG TPA: DUF655 domain-containing protein [Thermoplasmataceae archaeon]|nr:DUF655 domain-containing protein [Thermoplasmatales archaeon AK]HLH85933.1 DUF655 domain-containing protein [Thermoplasmataceae archaeon]
MEEFAYILDYLPQGRASDKSYHKTPLALAIGENEFKLLELIPRENAVITVGERVYVGKDTSKRDKIISVKRRIAYSDLTNAAMNELPFIVEKLVEAKEKDMIRFFNVAEPINARLHTLELLPGLGNKTMWTIIEERKKKPFESFKDLTDRVKTLHNVQKMIASRIIEELRERNEKHKLFVAK